MAPDFYESIREEPKSLLDAGTVARESAPWSFSVVSASNEDAILNFCADYRSLNQVMEADRLATTSL